MMCIDMTVFYKCYPLRLPILCLVTKDCSWELRHARPSFSGRAAKKCIYRIWKCQARGLSSVYPGQVMSSKRH
jgi:hypothetical protein